MTLLLKKLFLMSISMKNGKKPEMQHPASGNLLQGLAVPWPISHPAPRGRHQRDHNDRAMQGKEKKTKKKHIRLRLDDKEIIYSQVPERP